MSNRSTFLSAALITVVTLSVACGDSNPHPSVGGTGSTGGTAPGGAGGASLGGAGGSSVPLVTPTPANPGQTDFTTEDSGPAGGPRLTVGGVPGGGALDGATATPNATTPVPAAVPEAPGGRVADVEEGDIYKMVGNRLYYLNTYKGFIVYDVTNPKAPTRVSRLPVFGYPIEMYVEGNTVYALLKDALYLTQVNGKMEFARHNVSQLVTIDITDVTNPRVLKTLDIVGQLREGVSRKVENTIYVVSYWNRYYWWGWSYDRTDVDRQDQAWVYSYDISDRANPKQTGELKVFEGGAVSFYDPATGASFNRSFSGIAISATSNALMVVENWYISAGSGSVAGSWGCGYYNSDQQSVVSIVDISDPKGSIRVHSTFATAGSLTDQFKQTYAHNATTGKGTYFGIFARRGWSQTANCTGASFVQNTIESWDVTDGAHPARVGRLDFGKPNETVRGTAFDVSRNVAYAITARNVDPLYAISIADPTKLSVLSAIDGLSGDVSVFRLIEGNKFLLAVGRDNSVDCTGLQETTTAATTNGIAVSIIDVNDLAKIRLVQRQCVDVKNAAWVSSQVTWNLDQAHKMLGMHSDGEVNVITVPISYWKRNETQDWWWDRYETAVGIMSWDLARYNPAASHLQQTVIQNHGTFIHPNGEVRRSVLFKHADLKQRLMANLSDTHISIANIQDLANPQLESIVEVAPYLNELFRFGNYIVEQVQPRTNGGYWDAGRSAVEFRVKAAGGEIDSRAPVATFLVGQVQRAVKHGDQLVVFRYVPAGASKTTATGTVPGVPASSEAVVFDMADPAKPRLAGRVAVPVDAFPYYVYYCGNYFSGFWFDSYYGNGTSWADTTAGLVVARPSWDAVVMRQRWKLFFLDLRSPNAPVVTDREIELGTNSYLTALTVDAVDGRGFYLGYRTSVAQTTRANGAMAWSYKDFASRWELGADGWTERATLNIPGRLIRTFQNGAGERMLVTSDSVWNSVTDPATKATTYSTWTRLTLLREIWLGAHRAAERMDARVFENLSLASMVADGQRLFVNGRRYSYAVTPAGTAAPDLSDRLMAFDLADSKLNLVYDQSTKMYNVRLMGVNQGRLFANLPGDGILVTDVNDPAKPVGLHFARTLGYATHIEFAGDDVYVGSGFFGTTHINLRGAASLMSQ